MRGQPPTRSSSARNSSRSVVTSALACTESRWRQSICLAAGLLIWSESALLYGLSCFR